MDQTQGQKALSAWPPFDRRQGLIDRLVLIGLHLALLAALGWGLGWEFNSADYLADSTQFLSLKELQTHLGRSLAHLICQPPLYNLLIGLSLKISPAHFTSWLFGWHILWSCLAIWAVYGLARLLFGQRWLALVLAAWLPSAPDWLLYESWANYTFPVMAQGLVLVYLTCRYFRTRDLASLLAAAAVLNLMMLTRSLYHLLFGLVFCGGLVLFEPGRWRRTAAVLIVPTLVLTGGWYLKNHFQFGFWGASSWSYINLMRVVSHNRPPEFMKKHLAGTPQAYLYPVWRVCPGLFCDLVDHYFHALDHPQKGRVPVLHDLFEENLDGTRLHRNMNNINYLIINRDCRAAARRLIRADPWGYLANVGTAYRHFINPPTKYGYLKANRDLIEGYARWWERIVYARLPWPGGKVTPVFFIYPLLVPCFLWAGWRWLRSRGGKER
ncbi:MAG: glycosyltransferase family 39 protein, partial [Deltaproteobacteria bacterium]|nr:glycosyltransferase family 39 protein [Deltaproteobacteria bacterium]